MAKVLNIPVEFDIKDRVYLITDPDQDKRIVTGILIKPNKTIMYELTYLEEISYHYGFEITNDKDILTQMQ